MGRLGPETSGGGDGASIGPGRFEKEEELDTLFYLHCHLNIHIKRELWVFSARFAVCQDLGEGTCKREKTRFQ